jgi:hypothetical protein
MYDKGKATTWVGGQIELENGELVKFEFSPDKLHGGGKIRIVNPEGECSSFMAQAKLMNQASGLFGTKLRDLMVGGKNLFSGLVESTDVKTT